MAPLERNRATSLYSSRRPTAPIPIPKHVRFVNMCLGVVLLALGAWMAFSATTASEWEDLFPAALLTGFAGVMLFDPDYR